MAADSAPPLAKFLASSDKKVRDTAVKNLTLFLSDPSRDALPKSEMTKLWKGIFYCYWMSDKPLVQQALSSELASITLQISSTPAALAFLAGFWEAIVREWNGIDRLRMDKYYMLVRKFVYASLSLLMRHKWDEEALGKVNDMLTCKGAPLCPNDTRVPASLTHHLADVYLEELDKCLVQFDEDEDLPAPLSPLITPFLEIASRTTSNITYDRIESSLINPLLSVFRSPASSDDEDEEGGQRPTKRQRILETPTYENLRKHSCSSDPKSKEREDTEEIYEVLLQRLFDVASGPDTRDSNRRKMYALWKSAKAEALDGDAKSLDGS